MTRFDQNTRPGVQSINAATEDGHRPRTRGQRLLSVGTRVRSVRDYRFALRQFKSEHSRGVWLHLL